jgi:hypothetical protein
VADLDFVTNPSQDRFVQRDDTVRITGAEYLQTRRRLAQFEAALWKIARAREAYLHPWGPEARAMQQIAIDALTPPEHRITTRVRPRT